MQKLDHPAIPKAIDIIENNDNIYIVRDYIEGKTLETIVKNFGAQSFDNVIEWGKQLCAALKHLHSQNPPLIYRLNNSSCFVYIIININYLLLITNIALVSFCKNAVCIS